MAAQSTLRGAHNPLLQFVQTYSRLLRLRLRKTSRTTRLLGTLALTLSILCASYGGYRWWKKSSADRETGRHLLRRNSGLRGKDGSRNIYVPDRNSTSQVIIHPTKPTPFDAHRRLFLHPPRAAGLSDDSQPQVPPPQTK